MKHFTILFLFLLPFTSQIMGQCNGNINLTTQAEIDAFGLNECVNIIGDLRIGSFFGSSDITDLTPLSTLQSVSGDLRIEGCTDLISLSGLENLQSVGDDLDLGFNLSLEEITALANLSFVGEDILIWGNDNLNNLDGLENITTVNGDLCIGCLEFMGNGITDINGLQNVNYVGGGLAIIGNNIDSLNPLSNITFVGSRLEIIWNNNLETLEGLENIESVGNNTTFSDLNIFSNEGLTSIEALSANLVVNGDLNIYTNDQLNLCCSVLEFIDNVSGDITIENNAPGCNSLIEITAVCGLTEVQAIAFYDENENGVFDSDEQIVNQIFELQPDAVFDYSINTEGSSFFIEDFGTYTLSFSPLNPLWNVLAGNADFVEIDYLDDTFSDTIHYFPVVPVGDFIINRIDIASSFVRCNSTINYWLTYTNNGTTINDGYVQLIPDSLASFVSANLSPDSTAGDTLFWFYEDLYPTHSQQILVTYEMPGVDFIGEEIDFEVSMQNWDGTGDAKSTTTAVLVCSFDPNDKLVTPIGVGVDHLTLFDDTLEYTIRFQNTGNDTAFTVVVRDTLDDHLALSSFRPISSSHDMETSLDINSRVVTFTFNDIYLPDSVVNETASHGFVKFQILPQGGLPELTTVSNNAGIFFDLNPPIVTNTVFNTFTDFIGVELNAKIYLEGNYEESLDKMVKGDNFTLPLDHPYSADPWNYGVIIFIANVPENAIDWVLVEARSGTPSLTTNATEVVETQLGVLLDNGEIVTPFGGGLRFSDLNTDEWYHFVIRHRNHLDVMTALSLSASTSIINYDFTQDVTSAFGSQQLKPSSTGKAMMYAGDATGDGLIQTTDFDQWFQNNAVINTYSSTDFNLDGIIQVTDFDLWFINKAKVGAAEIQY